MSEKLSKVSGRAPDQLHLKTSRVIPLEEFRPGESMATRNITELPKGVLTVIVEPFKKPSSVLVGGTGCATNDKSGGGHSDCDTKQTHQ
jgi:hypothetical protein